MAGVTAKQVYDYVKEQIISKELFPGNRVAEEEVAEAMHTSRTTVRSALSRLHYDGLVDVIPNCGAFVAKPTMVDMYRVYAVRRVLEAEAARLAATRITEEALERMERGGNADRQQAGNYRTWGMRTSPCASLCLCYFLQLFCCRGRFFCC